MNCPHVSVSAPEIRPDGQAALPFTCVACHETWTTLEAIPALEGRMILVTRTNLDIPDGKRVRSIGAEGDYVSRAEVKLYCQKVDKAWRQGQDDTRAKGILPLVRGLEEAAEVMGDLHRALAEAQAETTRLARFTEAALASLESRTLRGRLQRLWAWIRKPFVKRALDPVVRTRDEGQTDPNYLTPRSLLVGLWVYLRMAVVESPWLTVVVGLFVIGTVVGIVIWEPSAPVMGELPQ